MKTPISAKFTNCSFDFNFGNFIVASFLSASANSVELLNLFRSLQPAHVGSYPG